MTGVAHAHEKTLTSPGENASKEGKCKADPTYNGSSGTACEESGLPRRSHMGSVITSSSCIAFANQLEMEKNMDGVYEPNWIRHQNPAVR